MIRTIDSLTCSLTNCVSTPFLGSAESTDSQGITDLSKLIDLEKDIFGIELKSTAISEILCLCKNVSSLPKTTASKWQELNGNGVKGIRQMETKSVRLEENRVKVNCRN